MNRMYVKELIVRGYVSVKSVGKYAQSYLITALPVDSINLHTRLL